MIVVPVLYDVMSLTRKVTTFAILVWIYFRNLEAVKEYDAFKIRHRHIIVRENI